jgi:hypothetical protein
MNADLTISPLPTRLAELRMPALMAAGVGWLGIIVGAIFWPNQVWSSYLWAFLICNGISLGSLGLIMLHRLTGGPWGIIVRRPAEAAAMNLPLMAVLFLPIPLLALKWLFPWSHADLVASDAVMQHKAAYLNASWFTIRAAIYFVVWIGL